MSIASAIANLQGRVASAYTAISEKGGTLPATQNTANLPTAISSIPTGGGGFEGYTLTIANDYEARQDFQYYSTNMPITLFYADGTTETLNMYNAASLRGVVKNNVIAIHAGLWNINEVGDVWVPWVSYLANLWDFQMKDDSTNAAAAVWMMSNNQKKYVLALLDGLQSRYNGFYTTPGLWNEYTLTDNTTITHSCTGCRCYLKGTLITIADGRQKPVEEITYNDNLLVWDFDRGCLATAKPLWIKKVAKAPYYFKNTLASGKVLLTTGQSKTGWGHRMFDIDKGAFKYTTESVSDRVFTLDGAEMHKSCERVEEECEYYNIITDFHMNLFANRILTSCSYNNLYPIKNMKFVKEGREPRPFEAYDVPLEYYKGLRLSEQTIDASDTNQYIRHLIEDAVSK